MGQVIDLSSVPHVLGSFNVAELLATADRPPSLTLAVATVCLFAFVMLRTIPVTLPRGESVRIDVYALILSLSSLRPIQALTIAILATILTDAASSDFRRPQRLFRDVFQVFLSVVLSVMAIEMIGLGADGEVGVLSAGATCLVAVIAVDTVLEALVGQLTRSTFRSLMMRELILGGMGVVHVSVATAAVTVFQTLGVLGSLLALAVVVALQESVALYFKARRTYWQTVAALARAAEMAWPGASGVSRALADFSVEVGRSLGLPRRQLEQLDFAARLREVGRLSESGDEELTESVLERSARIVRGITMLEPAGRVIEASIPGARVEDREIMRLGEILRASSRYLNALSSSADAHQPELLLSDCSAEVREAVLRVGSLWSKQRSKSAVN